MKSSGNNWGRREFVSTLITAAGTFPLVMLPGTAFAEHLRTHREKTTVEQVIDMILNSIPGAPFKQTVDTLKSGSADQQVTGVVTTMFATNAVIEKAGNRGANFIIAHEPTFYNHLDDTSWLDKDEVYQYKRDLLKKYDMVIWRLHDYIHAHKPDGVLMGVLTALGWEKYYDDSKPHIITLPSSSLGSIIQLAKKKLGITHVKMIGDLSQLCSRVALLPGAAGGRAQISIIQKERPDLLICGELSEWETAEYIRDLRHIGLKTALVVLGHAVSEEPGLLWLQQWLQPKLHGIKITHIPSYDPFKWA